MGSYSDWIGGGGLPAAGEVSVSWVLGESGFRESQGALPVAYPAMPWMPLPTRFVGDVQTTVPDPALWSPNPSALPAWPIDPYFNPDGYPGGFHESNFSGRGAYDYLDCAGTSWRVFTTADRRTAGNPGYRSVFANCATWQFEAVPPGATVTDRQRLEVMGLTLDKDFQLIPGRSLADPHPYLDFETPDGFTGWQMPAASFWAQYYGNGFFYAPDGQVVQPTGTANIAYTTRIVTAGDVDQYNARLAAGPVTVDMPDLDGGGTGTVVATFPLPRDVFHRADYAQYGQGVLPVSLPQPPGPSFALQVRDDRLTSSGIGQVAMPSLDLAGEPGNSYEYTVTSWLELDSWPVPTFADSRFRFYRPDLTAAPERLWVGFSAA